MGRVRADVVEVKSGARARREKERIGRMEGQRCYSGLVHVSENWCRC